MRTVASFVPEMSGLDDEWHLRVILHDFGQIWEITPKREPEDLVRDEPSSLDNRWDAFMAAHVEHLCWHAAINPPPWVFESNRYIDYTWYPATTSPTLRVEAAVHAPAAFQAHRVLVSDRELVVV